MDIKLEVYSVVSDVFRIPVEEIRENMTPSDIEGWDSLEQLNLVMAIENKFGISFGTEDMFNIVTIKSIIDIVSKKVSV